MPRLTLTTVGAVCAVLITACFVLGIVLMASSGVQVLIPDTGKDAIDWVNDVDDANGLFFAGAWLVILGGILGLVAFLGFYERFRKATPLMILAPILGAVGLVFVTISHALPIAMAYELVPGYVGASESAKESLSVTTDTLAATALALNYIGDVLVWAVVVPMYAWASLKLAAVPRWIGWLGLFTGVFAGVLGAFSPVSSVIDGITFLGFVGFFVWMAAMGVALLRRRPPREELPAAVPA
jgi:hypothetical protein